MDAAKEPELFQRVAERYPDGESSQAALKSFFMREGLTDTALPSAISSYLETVRFIENTIESSGNGLSGVDEPESVANQQPVENTRMSIRTAAEPSSASGAIDALLIMGNERLSFDWVNKRAVVSKIVRSRKDAADLIEFMNSMMLMLPEAEPVSAPTPQPETTED